MKWNAKNKGKLIKMKVGIPIKLLNLLLKKKERNANYQHLEGNSQPKNKEKKSNKTGIMCFPIEKSLFLRNTGYLLSGCLQTLMKMQ